MGVSGLLTEKEAASFLNISHETLKKARLYNRGPAYVQVGRCIRYAMSDLVDYIVANTVKNSK